MTDSIEAPDEALIRNLNRIKTEGLDAATEAALQLLRDSKAPSQARSATINAMYRAAGLFGRPDEGKEPDLHEMTPEQLARAVKDTESQLRRALVGNSSDNNTLDESVFD